MNRIGIFGGTFDPPHIAHLIIADKAQERLSLQKIVFVPAFVPPHKTDQTLSSFKDRIEMVSAATSNNNAFEVSDIEGTLTPPSYTVRTLSLLRKRLSSDSELYLIIGSDSLMELDSWREPRRIVSYAKLAVYPRPGFISKTPHWINSERIVILDSPELPISSTALRRQIRERRSIRYRVPESVREIILQKDLYRNVGINGSPSNQHEGINGESPLHS